jgi:hypothetical protein
VYGRLVLLRRHKKNDIAAAYRPSTIRLYLQQIMLAQGRIHAAASMGTEKDFA